MRKFVFAFLVISSLTFMTGNTYALPGLDLSAGVVVAVPTGDFADAAKTGYGLNADAFFGIPLFPLKVGGHVAYNRFSMKNADSEDFSIVEIVPSIRYSILPLVLWNVYAQVGAGYYYYAPSFSGFDSESKFGFNVGAGVSGMLIPTVSIYAMPMYNMIFTDDKKTSYFSLNVGMKF